MRFETPTGYSFEIDLDAVPDIETRPHECCAVVTVQSPRTMFFAAPRAVGRMALLQFAAHLRAMLGGFLEVADPEGEEGYTEFPDLSLQVRQVPSGPGSVAFQLSLHDCGCDDRVPFEHSAACEVKVSRDTLVAQLDAFEAELWADTTLEAAS